MWLGNIIHKDRELDGERLELIAEKDRLIYLGPNLTLRRCAVVVRVPASRLIIREARFIDCTIDLKQELRNHRDWVSASLEGCRFKGRMLGCDFGSFPGYTSGGEHGHVEDCDFSEARLDLCRFHNCDMRTLRLPRWPCFTILDPIGRGHELTSVEWPGSFRPVTLEGDYKEVPSVVATTFYAPAEAKRSGTTEDELKAAIERFDFIVH
ncbi:hypothetical protein JRI60_41070 [Archangium violaceum]|uniref:hypothetical protein n=1 Tax=Archangium violaceum TaxID=83451 RepID=UPI0019523B70|nr:hypothetical protein [Archangium violaceum]QRN95404.1 hypothetical protein JRI60_41070 [Archangium violaceum]